MLRQLLRNGIPASVLAMVIGLMAAPLSSVVWANESSAPHAATTESAHAEHTSSDPRDFVASDVIMEHILDSHEWHLTDLPNGTPIALHLPWIVYSAERGFETFSLHAHGHHAQAEELAAKGYQMNHETNAVQTLSGGYVLDLSITKAVLHMLIMAVVLILVFRSVAKGYKKNVGRAPKGVQSFFEPIIIFIREDIAKPNLHGKHERFMPFLLTVFFFIWFANLLGLTPLNSNIMGNISVTAALALCTLVLIFASSTKDYWGHIFWFPGVPVPLKLLLMLPVELMGVVIKPAALTIRLFANIAAGHFMVVSLIMLIFIIGEGGDSAGAGGGMAVGSMLFSTFIMLLEFLVAIVQAYVFTVLSAVFIGQAMETHSHAHDDQHASHSDHATTSNVAAH